MFRVGSNNYRSKSDLCRKKGRASTYFYQRLVLDLLRDLLGLELSHVIDQSACIRIALRIIQRDAAVVGQRIRQQVAHKISHVVVKALVFGAAGGVYG